MAKRADKIIIDTNLWISFLITKNFKKLDERIKARKIRIIFSLESIAEFLSVTNRSKFKKYFDKQDIQQLTDFFHVYGELFDVRSEVNLCRDPKDNFLLSLSKDSQADYLITGDIDLLDLKEIGSTKIITMNDYLKKLK